MPQLRPSLAEASHSDCETHENALGRSATLSRRQFIGSLAGLGAAALTAHPFCALFAKESASRARTIIDVHHHFYPPFVLEAWEKSPAASQTTLIPGVKDWTPARDLEELDRNGVTTALLSTSSRLSSVDMSTESMRKMARMSNEYATQMGKYHPGRFGLFAYLPLPDVEGSLKEIEYSLDVLKANGIGMLTSYGSKYPGDPEFVPIFDELNRRKAVVYFHPLAPACCINLIPDVTTSLLEYPQDTSRAILSLLFSGTFLRCRDIQWIFSHGGGTIPVLAGRIRTLTQTQSKKIAEVAPSGIDYEFTRLHFETANSAYPPTMAALLKYVPVSQVMFGTDYPYVTVGQNLADISKIGLPAADLEAIESRNALRLIPRLSQAEEKIG